MSANEIAVVGIHGSAPLAAAALESPDATGYLEKDGIGVARVRRGAAPAAASERYWLIGEQHGIARLSLADDPDRIERNWRLGDIRDGQPQVYAATCESFVAQMLNLDLIGGISFSKGCYTGQEIIARTQHLGRIKRRMSRLRLPSASWAIGQPIQLADGRTGRLTELARGRGFRGARGAQSRRRSGQCAERFHRWAAVQRRSKSCRCPTASTERCRAVISGRPATALR